MRQTQKILTIALWGLTVIAMMAVIGAGLMKRHRARAQAPGSEIEAQGASDATVIDAPVPPFALVDQDGKQVTPEQLKGHPWLASFVFTRCAGPCPRMTQQVATLAKEFPHPNLRFISVSVDPEHDTPQVLKEYARKFDADESRWRFLTGEKDAVFQLARGMLITAVPATAEQPIIHSEQLLMVDAHGLIKSAYHSNDEQDMSRLRKDIEALTPGSAAASPASSPAPPAPPASPAPPAPVQ